MKGPQEDFFFEYPQTADRIQLGQRTAPSASPRLFTGKPSVGLVITTYGAAPYVELSLAARQRLYPELPVMVHDDASPDRDALQKLCDKYGATFQCNSCTLGHQLGDLSGVVGGLYWARSAKLDLLVKMSRRCVPLANWIEGLQFLAETTQYATFGRTCRDFGLPLRTECFAMAVQPWTDASILDEMKKFMLTNRTSIMMEPFIFQFVQRVYEMNSVAARKWERENVLLMPRPPFIGWEFLTEGRRHSSSNYLWHETAPVEAYVQVGAALGLSYTAEDFAGICSQGQT